jgi:predicted RNase H-like nuclease (RuvC/YqgF family)
MNALKAAALHDRAAAESEKEMFAHELSEYRNFLEQQRQMFVAVTDTVIQNCHTRELEKERKEEAIRQKASGRIEKLRSLVREKEAESEQLQAKLVELNKSVKIYEESFQQVCYSLYIYILFIPSYLILWCCSGCHRYRSDRA